MDMTKRILGGVLAALVLTSCTTDNKSSALVVTSVIMGTATSVTLPDGTVSTSCAFAAGTQETEFPIFAVNSLNNNNGSAGFVVQNQLVTPPNANTVFISNSTIFSPHQAVVDYEIIGGGTSIAQQIIPVSGGSVASSSSAVVIIPLFLPTAALAAAKALPAAGGIMRATVRIEGKLDDGSTATTSEHEFVFAVQTAATAVGTPCF
jgi:hypothetical protein